MPGSTDGEDLWDTVSEVKVFHFHWENMKEQNLPGILCAFFVVTFSGHVRFLLDSLERCFRGQYEVLPGAQKLQQG